MANPPRGRFVEHDESADLQVAEPVWTHYPEVAPIESASYPEAAPPRNDKEVVPSESSDDQEESPISEGTGTAFNAPYSRAPSTAATVQRPWWRKAWGLALIAVLLGIIIIAAAIGGVVGSRAARNSGEDSRAGAQTTATPTSSSSTTSPTSFAPVNTVYPSASPLAVAAGVNFSSSSAHLQVFYQSTDSTELLYTTYGNAAGSFNATQKMKLTLPVSPKAPMAMTSRIGDGSAVIVNLFYLYQSDANATHVAMAEINCPRRSATCAEGNATVISTNATGGVHAYSGVAALWLGEKNRFRVYFQAVNGSLTEMRMAANGSWTGHFLSGTAAADGSSIAAAFAGGSKLSVFYADAATGNPGVIDYSGGWKTPNIIDPSPPAWNASASLAACYEPTADTHRFYFATPGDGQLVEYTRTGGASGNWSRTANASSTWESVDSGVAAVAWLDQVRLYYLSGGKPMQSLMGNATWKATTEIGS